MTEHTVDDELVTAQRIRLHERLQIASGLIAEVEDELRHHDEERRTELKTLGHRVWELGYELLGDVEDTGERA